MLSPVSGAADKIFVQDGDEEVKEMEHTDAVIEPTFNFDEKKQTRLSQEMRNKIPVEEEEHFNPGMPVSPVSVDGTDIRITTGAQSLESTLSDGADIRNAIREANQPSTNNVEAPASPQSEIDQQADKITDDIFR